MDLFNEDYKITKPLRLIELFAGYGSQAMAFDRIGVKYEHHFVCEFDKYAMKSYNAVHGTNFEPTDIRNIHAEDLNIVDIDKYCYFMTYSFPCTDLSLAGKQAGMKKGSGTRSGLLWEVERLLTECKELPQVLFMENVPQVIAEKNMPDFLDWLKFLHKKGYSSYYKVLNAKDYGVPQNRKRCFMFSFLGDYDYVFPEPTGLKQLLVDVLEDEVDEKYYINNDIAKKLIADLIQRNVLPISNSSDIKRVGNISNEGSQCGTVVSNKGLFPTLSAGTHGYANPHLMTEQKKDVIMLDSTCQQSLVELEKSQIVL